MLKALGIDNTLDSSTQEIELWLKQESQQDLDPNLIHNFLHIAITDVAEIISGAGSDDYNKDQIISDQASSQTATIVTGANYVESTRTVEKTAHGLVTADIGKRIALWDGTSRACIAEIESITDSSHFVVSKALGLNATGTVNYAVFSSHATSTIDLSSYRLVNITKILDSTNGEVKLKGDKQFDNIERFDNYKDSVFYNKRGQNLFLKKGSDVTTYGTLTMSYTSYPQRATEQTDKLDIRDVYYPLVIAKAKNYCYEHLNAQPSESLDSFITSRTNQIRDGIIKERQAIEVKNKTSQQS